MSSLFSELKRLVGPLPALGLWLMIGPASADGGISSLGALLPVFVVIGFIGTGLLAWLLMALIVVFKASISRRAISTFRGFANVLMWVTLIASVVGSTWLSLILLLAGLAIAVLVGLGTALACHLARDRIVA